MENPVRTLAPLACPVEEIRPGVNLVPIHLRYYCHNTDNKDAL